MMKKSSTKLDIMSLARLGAKAEIDLIRKAFPDLLVDQRRSHGGIAKTSRTKLKKPSPAKRAMLGAFGVKPVKLHWTQKPENKKLVIAMTKRAAKTRKAAQARK